MYDLAILTPVLNRANKLELIASTLDSEKYNIIWIIGDDGSSDDIEFEVKKIYRKYNLNLKYIKSNIRIGKAKIDNLLIDNANAKYVVWCDAGDYFVENSIDNLLDKTIKYSDLENDENYIGLIAMNVDQNYKKQTIYDFELKNEDVLRNWNDLERNILGDGTIIINKKIIGSKRFPEVDFVVNESSLWRRVFYGKKILITQKVSKIMERKQVDSISNSTNEIKYLMGMFISIQKSEFKERYSKISLAKKIRLNIRYFRYAKHLKISTKEAINQWEAIRQDRIVYFLGNMISYIYYLRDILSKKIILTHKQMKNEVEIKITDFRKNENS